MPSSLWKNTICHPFLPFLSSFRKYHQVPGLVTGNRATKQDKSGALSFRGMYQKMEFNSNVDRFLSTGFLWLIKRLCQRVFAWKLQPALSHSLENGLVLLYTCVLQLPQRLCLRFSEVESLRSLTRQRKCQETKENPGLNVCSAW